MEPSVCMGSDGFWHLLGDYNLEHVWPARCDIKVVLDMSTQVRLSKCRGDLCPVCISLEVT